VRTTQIPLELEHTPSFDLSDFIISSANEKAAALLNSWQSWPSHTVALIGPKASGKSHLAAGWAKENDAFIFTKNSKVSDLKPDCFIVCEDADSGVIEEQTMFHLYNWVKEIKGKLLLTARSHPTKWQVDLPDLRSRLATITVGEIKEPDDNLLIALLIKLFSDRQLQVNINVIHYIIPRIERSFLAVRLLVEELDELSLRNKRKITKALARDCLEVKK